MRPKVLLAPVTITPTKPLSPSHLKGLLWTDVMFRATSQVADVTYRCSHTTYHPVEQTVGFWEYLDRTQGDTDYSACTDEEIGQLYVRYRADARPAEYAALRPYLDAIENAGWVHPASRRMLDLWSDQYARLGLHDPGLHAHAPPEIGVEEMIGWLGGLDMCLDLRDNGGPVFLDLTSDGMALRRIVDAAGKANYVACALRELMPLAAKYDEIVLLYDRELEPDYLLLQRVLSRLGTRAHRIALGRVPIDGQIRSARYGGRRDHSVDALLAVHDDERVVRLGLRLYFIAMHGPGSHESFRPDLLRRWMTRTQRLLAGAAEQRDSMSLTSFLTSQRGEHSYVDPYRLTSGLLAHHCRAPVQEVLSEVYL